ncbi:ABC transporter permease [Puia dinghuensis]|nr:ABC transporter permease [Puia dinghuensis]
MIKNYLKIALRQLRKQRFYSAIKIGGFALGIATCLLMTLYIQHETSFDKTYPNGDRLYRVYAAWHYRGQDEKDVAQSPATAQAFKAELPEVEASGRIMPYPLFNGAGSNEVMPENKTQDTYEQGFAYMDQSLLDMFQLPMVYGDRSHALAEPNTILISKRKADKYFPGINPVGKLLYLNNDKQHPYKIGGVMADLPPNSHLDYDFFLTLTGKELWKGEQTSWMSQNYDTYVLLRPGVPPQQLDAKMDQVVKGHWLPAMQQAGTPNIQELLGARHMHLQPVSHIHLDYDIGDSLSHGDIRFVWLFGAVAVLILALASINFINLSTARSANRAKEVGLRKVVGSLRIGLIQQFLIESLVLSYFAFLLALGLALVMLPLFNRLAATALHIPWTQWWLLPLLLLAATSIGVLSGLYPSFYLSKFRPVEVLKGRISSGSRHSSLRGVLVVFQFTTSVILIVATVVIYRQMQFIMNKKMGFDKDQVMLIEGAGTLDKQLKPFKNQLLNIQGVKSVSLADYLPVSGGKRNNNQTFIAGRQKIDPSVGAQTWRVDPDYVKTFGMKLVAGRMFSYDIASDTTGVVVNETLVKKLGIKDPIGKEIFTWYDQHIIGVVADFNFESVRQEVGPVVLHRGDWANTVAVKMNTADIASLIKQVRSVWKSFSPHQELRYTFLDESFARMYADVRRMGDIFTSFASLAIIIACLGLFGLSAFMAEQRAKELGIRKVLGATVGQLAGLLSKDFLRLVLISIFIASPIAWWGMHRWLQDFAYRIDIGVWIFAAAGAMVILVALVTISFQALKAAVANPVHSLKAE